MFSQTFSAAKISVHHNSSFSMLMISYSKQFSQKHLWSLINGSGTKH